jgi:putative endonuclease
MKTDNTQQDSNGIESSQDVFAVYVMADSIMTTFISITNDLRTVIELRKNNADPNSFTSRYSLHNLVYYELYSSQHSALNREVKLKSMSKSELQLTIQKMNPTMKCIYSDFLNGNTPQILDKEISGKRSVRRKKSYNTTPVYSLRALSSYSSDD